MPFSGHHFKKLKCYQFSQVLLPEVVAGSVPPAFVFCDEPSYEPLVRKQNSLKNRKVKS
jgi:hypothetical protein